MVVAIQKPNNDVLQFYKLLTAQSMIKDDKGFWFKIGLNKVVLDDRIDT